MATKTLICLALLVSPAVWAQSASPVETEENRSQVPIFLNQHLIKVIAADLNDGHVNNDQQVVSLTTQASVDTDEIVPVTEIAEPEEDDDVTSATSLPVKSGDEQQVPIFLNQHMFNVIGKEEEQNNEDNQVEGVETSTEVAEPEEDGDVTSATSLPVKSGDEQQVPIFLNQHMFNVIGKEEEQKNEDHQAVDAETSTDVNADITERPEEAVHHHVPMFPDEQIVKDIINVHDKESKVPSKEQKNDETSTTGPADDATTSISIDIPEPKEHYKNNIYLVGHHRETNVHHHVMVLLSSAMTQELSYGSEHLSTYPLSTTYEYTSAGFQVTHMEYVVTYNGRVLAEYEVTHTLSRPRPSQYLHHGLHSAHLSQHFSAEGPLPTQAVQTQKNTYITPVIVVVSTLAVVAVLLLVVTVVYVKRTRASSPKSKDKKELMKYIMKADKTRPKPMEPIRPPPYSENPAYEV